MDTIPHSDYLIFVDESGDHGLIKLDPDFPVFALVFCIISKRDYIQSLVPDVQQLKFDIWGHDQIVLHEHDIRKEKKWFALLRTNKELRENFYERLSLIIAEAPMTIVASIIDKKKLLDKYTTPFNPYELALRFCMERALDFLHEKGENGKRIHVLIEGRGKKEDDQLELEFRRICSNHCDWHYGSRDFQTMSFEPLFVSKSSNCTGLQIADLLARPFALNYLRPTQSNRTYDILDRKRPVKKNFP